MRSHNVLAVALVALTLVACSRPAGEAATGEGGRGRYAGAGVYPAGRMWSQMAGVAASKDAAAARLGDDEQVIVVVDSHTGEVRQCGALSGYCVRMNPWAAPAGAAPITLAKHADQVDREAAAESGANKTQ